LLRIATALNGWQSLEGLEREVLRLVLQSVPADRAAILAVDPETGATGACYGWRRSGDAGPVAVSQFVLEKVFKDQAALLGQFGEGSPAPSRSVLSAGIQSLIAAPMLVGTAVVGVLYLDTLTGGTPLTEESLQFASAVAAMAAQPLESARRIDELQTEKQRLEADLGRGFDMIGDSPAMQRVYQSLERIAPRESTVLILGETGSGKELAARAIHRGSHRAKGPFVAINCAAIAENLLESELFGHERGAFTGAVAQKRGKLEMAHTGTLFLDEVGELPLSLQAKLLRALQEREFDRLGGTRPVSVDLRLVAATNRDLQALVSEGRFRSDLYYRLNVISLRMPPLRDRADDVVLLATYFLTRMLPSAGRAVRGFSPRAKTALRAYDWPGNVRELQNAIERAVVLGNSDWIEPDELAEEIVETEVSAGPSETYHAQVLAAKQGILKAALAQSGGSYIEAARALGIHVKHLHRLMKTYGLKEAARGGPAVNPRHE
jgi:Nif-specific regulatory protein